MFIVVVGVLLIVIWFCLYFPNKTKIDKFVSKVIDEAEESSKSQAISAARDVSEESKLDTLNLNEYIKKGKMSISAIAEAKALMAALNENIKEEPLDTPAEYIKNQTEAAKERGFVSKKVIPANHIFEQPKREQNILGYSDTVYRFLRKKEHIGEYPKTHIESIASGVQVVEDEQTTRTEKSVLLNNIKHPISNITEEPKSERSNQSYQEKNARLLEEIDYLQIKTRSHRKTKNRSNYKTFSQWSRLGKQVIKGEKATFFNDIPNFSENQVTPAFDNKWFTYDDWLDKGFQVKKGENGTVINSVNLFQRSQVVKK